jgi:hypothetical protein
MRFAVILTNVNTVVTCTLCREVDIVYPLNMLDIIANAEQYNKILAPLHVLLHMVQVGHHLELL